MKKIPTATSSFKNIIEEGYLYIDKTQSIYSLVTNDDYYFLSRPRRFGKSLLISTLEQLFLGNKELFKGLWIHSSNYDWPKHPVITLDFSALRNESAEKLEQSLASRIDLKAHELNIDVSPFSDSGDKLEWLVKKLAEKNKVVILIDEYDYPVLNTINNLELAQANLKVMSSFFTVIKALNRFIRTVVITGVSQFSKANVFSGLNNLNDISLDPIAATLLGYTEQEITTYFSSYIKELAAIKNRPAEEIQKDMRIWYNGYRFSKITDKVYNPFSVHFLFKKNEFANYWFKSGIPTFLVNLLAKENFSLKDIEQSEFSINTLESFALDKLPLVATLFQTGFLTIQDYNEKKRSYTLNFPNFEVKESFTLYLFSAFSKANLADIERLIPTLQEALKYTDMEKFCITLQALFAHIPYQIHINQEAYYHSLFQLLVVMLGYETQSELTTNKGRIDVVIITKNHIYIFEIKLKGTPEAALKQIQKRGYAERFALYGKKITLVGIAFNPLQGKLSIRCASKTL